MITRAIEPTPGREFGTFCRGVHVPELEMNGTAIEIENAAPPDWPFAIYEALKTYAVAQVAYVPDAGHSRLIELACGDPGMQAVVLTSEAEGVALCAGAWLGGQRSVLLMQSSGVGNCINMLSLMEVCRFPLLTLVTMRGEWAEFNTWQVPMGRATQAALELMGVTVIRLTSADEAAVLACEWTPSPKARAFKLRPR